jgi:hypothetical protein
VSPILGIYASQISGHLFTQGTFDSIATTTVGSGGASSVTFSSIPSTYTHLQVRVLGRSTNASTGQSLTISLNNDTTAGNYYFHRLRGDGSSALADAYSGEREIVFLPAATATASVFGVAVIDILDYTSTNKNKTIRSFNGRDVNGTGLVAFQSELYFATPAAVATLTFTANLAEYTQIALYGIKGN